MMRLNTPCSTEYRKCLEVGRYRDQGSRDNDGCGNREKLVDPRDEQPRSDSRCEVEAVSIELRHGRLDSVAEYRDDPIDLLSGQRERGRQNVQVADGPHDEAPRLCMAGDALPDLDVVGRRLWNGESPRTCHLGDMRPPSLQDCVGADGDAVDEALHFREVDAEVGIRVRSTLWDSLPNRQDCRFAQPEAAPKGCGMRLLEFVDGFEAEGGGLVIAQQQPLLSQRASDAGGDGVDQTLEFGFASMRPPPLIARRPIVVAVVHLKPVTGRVLTAPTGAPRPRRASPPSAPAHPRLAVLVSQSTPNRIRSTAECPRSNRQRT